MTEIRTRFAPSPTGWLHVGGLRTALFAWLVTKQANGKFILRLEDTDKSREVDKADQHIMESLKWLGLDWDEGPDKNGPYGPYKQSQRLNIYKDWADRLIETGRAYPDPYTEEEVEAFRNQAKANKKAFLYRDFRPSKMSAWDGKTPLRFKSEPKEYTWYDEVMGELHGNPEAIDDFIILKSDGFPTYNFAHIIDDYLMKVSHVIRSQEFLASVPRFLNLYEALAIERPVFATLPPVLELDGKKKLSKRTGAKDILDYARDGFLPDALFNFMATLGWNDGTTQEIFLRREIINKFNVARVQKSGAKFDEHRLIWMNGLYIRAMGLNDLYEAVADYWPDKSKKFDKDYKLAVLNLIQERLKFFSELPELTNFFFEDIKPNESLIKDNKYLSKASSKELVELLSKSRSALEKTVFNEKSLSQALNNLLVSLKQKPAFLFSLIRIATTWAPASPGLAETLAVIGKEKTLRRLDSSIEFLSEA